MRTRTRGLRDLRGTAVAAGAVRSRAAVASPSRTPASARTTAIAPASVVFLDRPPASCRHEGRPYRAVGPRAVGAAGGRGTERMRLPMHVEIRGRESLEPPTDVERAVLLELLAGEHGLWTRAELERAVSGPRGNPGNVEDAINHLCDTGLVHVFGEFVAPTRAARQMDQPSI
jgi:hypothetical protein